jgi:glycosyltransferase involved in cell wall biosynthesis
MRIGINTRFLLSSKMEGFGWYTFEVVKRLVLAHPEHEFVFFFDRPFDPKFIFAPNVKPVVLFPPARHPLLFIWYFNFRLAKAIQQEKIDILFSPDGYLALRSTIPQIAVIHDLNFEHYPEDIPRFPRWYLRTYFPKFARKAAHIITVSNYSKQDIVQTYGIQAEKISVAWNGASSEFQPLTEIEIQATRDRFSHSRPYFIFVGSIHPRKNLKRLIAGFETFCGSNQEIDLLIVGSLSLIHI